ncbi:sensor histidine kinase [Rhizomicrobium electricum]|uniref:histidine kinase n=1 Tax=Rhizomicrobium electricum TaxID=480070 RepID=A0ABN1ELB3_9PROT|nr:ATP-binding protein [Rhizomicrobium electricum]NIJ47164.1 nitrogen fixation/metabolism regulation signal transduction histidine kinase [Rhizomicrobium electricum]
MVCSRFQAEIGVRTALLALTLFVFAWIVLATSWIATGVLVLTAAVAEAVFLARYAARASRETARFLDALTYEDVTQSFAGFSQDGASQDLGKAMARVMAMLRASRSEREEQRRLLQTLLDHMPVALVAIAPDGTVEQLNPAARRLFETPVKTVRDFQPFGEAFAAGIASLKPGDSALVPIERGSGPLHLKIAATEFVTNGSKRRLLSLQNIANELSAQELAAWQTVIRTMAHEVMNSLTPMTSLAATARDLVEEAARDLPADTPSREHLDEAAMALATVAKRSEGLLQFVQSHRRLTHRLTARPERLSVRRVFVRLHSLIAPELEANGIAFTTPVEPETLEVTADAVLLDQALINLLRNALDALRGRPDAKIVLAAQRTPSGQVLITVSDNGPGIAAEQRENIFAPFYTTKREGTGVGLTLVRQIAAVHGASVVLSETPGGGATFKLTF